MKKTICIFLAAILALLLFGCSSGPKNAFVLYQADGNKHGKKITEISYKQESELELFVNILNYNEGEYKGKDENMTAEAPDYILELVHVNDNGDNQDVYIWLEKERVFFRYDEYPGNDKFNDDNTYVSTEKGYQDFMSFLNKYAVK